MPFLPFQYHAYTNFAIFVVLFFMVFPQSTLAANPKWEVGTSVFYSSGDYGGQSTTTTLYVPYTVKRFFEKGDVSITIPYLRITSDQSVTFVSGNPQQTKKGKNKTNTTTTSQKETHDGLGDMILRGRYFLTEEDGIFPAIDLVGFVKFPTANKDKGLGTGKFDEGFRVEASKYLTNDLVGFAGVGYTFIGSPSGIELKDQWNLDVGAGYNITHNLMVSGFYEESSALISGGSNPRNLLFSVSYTLIPPVKFSGLFLVGLSDGAPDYALSGGVGFRF